MKYINPINQQANLEKSTLQEAKPQEILANVAQLAEQLIRNQQAKLCDTNQQYIKQIPSV